MKDLVTDFIILSRAHNYYDTFVEKDIYQRTFVQFKRFLF
jgi:hypothetical protein